jgi:hypothetical protein
MPRLILLACLVACNLTGQTEPSLTLTLTSPTADYYLGETIPLTLSFTANVPNAFVAQPVPERRFGGSTWPEQYLIDPGEGTEDPLPGHDTNGFIGSGIIGGPRILSGGPYTVSLLLNESVRFRRPGTYRLHVISHRIGRILHPDRAASSILFGSGEVTPVTITSGEITLHLHAAPAGWVKDQITEAVRFIDGTPPQAQADMEARRKAIRTLRFLNTIESAGELARRMDNGSGVTVRDLEDTSHPTQALAILEHRLVAPEEAIDQNFLRDLAEIAALAGNGELTSAENGYITRLVAALPAKRPHARAACEFGLLNAAYQTWPRPDWTGRIAGALIADFHELWSEQQTQVLMSSVPDLQIPAMLPILREVYATLRGPRADQADAALRRIYEIAPDEGRRLILEEIRSHRHHIPFSTLAMLPDASLPELDDALSAGYESRLENSDRLILRYATGAIVDRVKRTYQARGQGAGPGIWVGPLVYYFLKYDPAFGETELRRSLNTPGGPPAQYDLGFQFLTYGAWAMSPALEHLAIGLLSSSSVPLKRGTAELLGKYGSPFARDPLWHTMEFFRSWWKGREAELEQPPGEEGRRFEQTLITALAQADAWVLSGPELAHLDELCSTPACHRQVQMWQASAKPPVMIRIGTSPTLLTAGIGPYEIRSEEQLRRKLRQYPSGTSFRVARFAVDRESPDMKTMRERVEAIVRESGHTAEEVSAQ